MTGERVTERLAGRLVALGVTGSIAAFKSVELLRLLQAEGAEVVVLLTPSAARFVAPLTLEALSRHAVETDVLALLPDGRIGHIVAADSADALVVAPATAHWLGAMANGLAGRHRDRHGHRHHRAGRRRPGDGRRHVVASRDPSERRAAPGRSSATRSSSPRAARSPRASPASAASPSCRGSSTPSSRPWATRPIRAADPAARPPVVEPPREPDLEGRHVVISAGGTAEPIDPVRFIGNRSTGKMGVALAQAALDRGARVTLVAANVSVALPDDALAVRVETTAQMRDAVLDLVDGADALIMAAAVADFRPRRAATKKLSRDEGLTIELEPTEDILAGASAAVRAPGARRPRPILVGFAAETGSLERAAEKLRRKGVDFLVANDVAEAGSGFGTDTNRVTILAADGPEQALPLLSKREVADRILDRVAAALDDRDALDAD